MDKSKWSVETKVHMSLHTIMALLLIFTHVFYIAHDAGVVSWPDWKKDNTAEDRWGDSFRCQWSECRFDTVTLMGSGEVACWRTPKPLTYPPVDMALAVWGSKEDVRHDFPGGDLAEKDTRTADHVLSVREDAEYTYEAAAEGENATFTFEAEFDMMTIIRTHQVGSETVEEVVDVVRMPAHKLHVLGPKDVTIPTCTTVMEKAQEGS